MKKYLLAVSVFLSLSTFAQTDDIYNVIKVNGNIFNVTQSQELLQGNSVLPKDQLNFRTNSFAFVISNTQKKYMLKTPNIESADKDIFSNAELALSPIRSRGQLSTRGAMGESGVKDFKTYLGIENFNIVGNIIDIKMDTSRYKLSADEYIVFYYTINGNKVSKKIGYDGQVLNIDKEKLIVSKSDTLFSDTIPELSVYTVKQSTGASELVTKIDLCFLNEDVLKQELLAIVPVLKKQNMDQEAIKKYLVQYVFDIYGNVDEDQIGDFVQAAITIE